MAIETKVGAYVCSGCGIGESINCDQLIQVASKEIKVTDSFSLPVFGSVILNPNSQDLFFVFGFSL